MSNIDRVRNRIRNNLKQKQIRSKELTQKYNNKWGTYYNSKVWKGLRSNKITQTPYCESCYKHKGVIIPAEEVHHVIPFGTGMNEQHRWQLFTDYSNLVSLCSECHNKIHELMRKHHRIIDIRYESIYNDKIIAQNDV